MRNFTDLFSDFYESKHFFVLVFCFREYFIYELELFYGKLFVTSSSLVNVLSCKLLTSSTQDTSLNIISLLLTDREKLFHWLF